jgi:4-amino-4-deoxy-L-arabinose transferase-like glycosyltransferase
MFDHKLNFHNIKKHYGEKFRDSEWIWIFGLFCLAILLFGFNLGNLPLRDWDEGTIASVAREIWRSPDRFVGWLYPTLNGQPYLNKPPLIHSLIAISYNIFGISEWSTRLPGAALTSVSVSLLYLVGRELFTYRSTAVFSTLVYLTLLPVARHGRLAMLDGSLVCFFLLLILCLLRLHRDRNSLLGISLGLTLVCLTKGIMMGLLLTAIAVIFSLWHNPKIFAQKSLWFAIVLGIFPVLVWYALQYFHYGGQFLSVNLVDQTFSRVWVTVEKQTGTPWYYFLGIIKYTAPWLIFIPQAFIFTWQNRNSTWAKLILVWSGLYLLAISVMTTKLPWYIFPVYPAIAIAIGAYLDKIWRSNKFIYPRVWSILLGFLAFVSWIGSIYFGFFSPISEVDIQATLVAIASTMTIATIYLNKNNRYFISTLISGLYLTLLIFFVSNNWIWELAESFPVKPVAQFLEENTSPKQIIYTSYIYNRPSLDFYSDRQVISLPKEEIKNYWLKEKNVYLLIEPNLDRELNLNDIKIVNTTKEWQLITKRENRG